MTALPSAKHWTEAARDVPAKEWGRARLYAWYSAGAAFDADGVNAANPFDPNTESGLAFEWAYFFDIRLKAADERAQREKYQGSAPSTVRTAAARRVSEPANTDRRGRKIVTTSEAYAEQLGGVAVVPDP